MESCIALEFSVRSDETVPIEVTAERVGHALDCEFSEGRYYGVSAYVTQVFGLRVGLLEWAGLAGQPTFRLDGNVVEPRFAQLVGPGDEVVAQDISQAVACILRARGAGDWRVPSSEELDAEADFEREMTELYDS